MGMILTARHVSAKEGSSSASSTRWCRRRGPGGRAALGGDDHQELADVDRASKQTIQKGLAVSLEQAIEEQREYPAVKAMVASQDYIEGPKAFSEKRPPKWVGK
jgi:crotonobetainyl-CoA hydratase